MGKEQLPPLPKKKKKRKKDMQSKCRVNSKTPLEDFKHQVVMQEGRRV